MSLESNDKPAATLANYGATAKLLHWLVAALIVLQYLLAELAERAAEHQAALAQLALLANHKSVGITVLVLALTRMVWRVWHPAPRLPAATPAWQRIGSALGHWSLYLLLLLVPVTGWLMSSASAYSVSWFNLFMLPDLVSADEQLKELLRSAHHLLAEVLFVLALVHIGAALLHHFWFHDEVLKRMLDRKTAVVFLLVSAVGGYALTTPASNLTDGKGTTAPPSQDTAVPADDHITPGVVLPEALQSAKCGPGAAGTDSIPTAWLIDYANSAIEFTGTQAGATFTGQFDSWQAKVQFAPAKLAASCALVRIELASVNSQDSDRDATVAEPDWFDTKRFPVAYFSAGKFSNSNPNFSAAGELWIKGHSYPLNFDFTLVQDSNDPSVNRLQGSASIDRLAMQLGTGDWLDTSWVGQQIEVQVRIQTLGSPAQQD